MSFQSFGLQPKLNEALTAAGFTAPTPIQAKAIPAAMNGRDILACAQTGTGKTAAFALPLINHLMKQKIPTNCPPNAPRALILTPTRELAMQVNDAIRTFSKGANLKSTVVVGGMSFPPQVKALARPLDILVATPGRLIDHLQQGTVSLKHVSMLVLDEADRMLDMGFLKPVERIMQALAEGRQTMLFSATFDQRVEGLSKRFLDKPEVIKIAAATQQHTQITQSLYYTEGKEHKTNLLKELLENKEVWQAVVFMKTKHATDRMAKRIETWGHTAAALNGNMKQNARKRVIDQMHSGKLRVLVATDVAARGIDVKEITHVFNFDLPQVAEDYIHRIGRTGRAGKSGEAVSLIGAEDIPLLADIEKLMQTTIKPLNDMPEVLASASRRPAPAGGHRKGRSSTSGGPRKNRASNGRGNGQNTNKQGGNRRSEGRKEGNSEGRGENVSKLFTRNGKPNRSKKNRSAQRAS